VQHRQGESVAWRCYIADHPASGATVDLKAAERQLKAHVRIAERLEERIAVAA
jgi:hypothetical protein